MNEEFEVKSEYADNGKFYIRVVAKDKEYYSSFDINSLTVSGLSHMLTTLGNSIWKDSQKQT